VSVFIPRRIEVLVTSYGGVGTTAIIEFLSRHRVCNDHHDGDGFKHLPVPPVSLNPGIRCVYIFGDPVLAAVSLFQRGMQHDHSRKLLAFRPDLSPIPEGMTLEAYARAADRLHFQAHFENWHARHLVHPTLFLRYETAWDHLDALADFLHLPEGAMDAFPEKRERNARLDDLPSDTLAGLERMYGGFRDDLARRPDAEVRGEGLAGKRLHLIRTRNFRMALGKATNENYRKRVRNPLSNAIQKRLPRVHAALVKAKHLATGE